MKKVTMQDQVIELFKVRPVLTKEEIFRHVYGRDIRNQYDINNLRVLIKRAKKKAALQEV